MAGAGALAAAGQVALGGVVDAGEGIVLVIATVLGAWTTGGVLLAVEDVLSSLELHASLLIDV